MNQPKVTILMRAYNAEKYVAKAIESVLSQTDGNFEFIIRNNGSTDKTGEIIKSYIKDERIVFLENKVNWVLDPGEVHWWPGFHGEYITILDADDYWHPDFIKVMYEAAKSHDADLTTCGCMMFLETHPEKMTPRIPPKAACTNLKELQDKFIDLYGCLRTVWGKFYKRDFYLEHYHFAINCPIHASSLDTYTVLGFLEKCRSFVSVPQPLYYYCVRDNSASRVQNVEPTRIKEAEYLYNRGLECLKALDICTQTNHDALYLFHESHINDLRNLVLKSETMKPVEKVAYYEAILNDPIYAYYALPHQVRQQTVAQFMQALQTILGNGQTAYVLGKNHYLARYYLCQREIANNQINALTFPRLLSLVCDPNNRHRLGDELLALKWPAGSVSIRRFLKLDNNEKRTAFEDIKTIRDIFSQSDNPAQYQANIDRIQNYILSNQWEAALSLLNQVSATHPLAKECLFLRIYLSYQLGDLDFAMDACNISLFFWKDDEDIQNITRDLIREINLEDYTL